jgi:hypothetical protein
MIRWLASFLPSKVSPSLAAPVAPRGFDAAKAQALSTYATKTRSAYALTMHGHSDLAYQKLTQRQALTPELIEYAKGPGAETLKSLGQAMSILADAAGDVEVPDGKGGLVTVKEQLAQFRTTFPESGER